MTRLLVALLLVAGSAGPALAQTGNFKQILMQDVTGAFIRAPRISTSQRDASTHNTGEVIWCTDCAPVGLWVFDGTIWIPLGSGGGGGGDLTGGGIPPQIAFWTAPTVLSGDSHLLWGPTPPTPVAPVFGDPTKALMAGTPPQGTLKPGHVFVGLNAPSNATGMQAIQAQVYQGAPGLAGLVTLGDDRVGISSWNFRGTGASNPIYGANFGVVFNTNGVANGLEIDVQNDSATNYQGQALWLNGSTRAAGASGTVGHRANAILIDTQDGSKWERGILFKEGFVGNGATGSIEKMGIHFENSQDADFIVIQPRTGTAGNIAMKLTNPEFTVNRFTLLNSGAIRVGNTMTGAAFPSYAFVEDQTTGLYMEADAVLGFAIKREITCPVTVPPQVPPCFAGDRRMTLGAATTAVPALAPSLNLWPWGTGANQGGTLNLFDPSSVHAVGLLAPDFIANSFRIRLPAAPGAAGQCVITGGGSGSPAIETWSYGACGTGGGGGGGTVTNTGVLTLNALIVGNGGVDVKALASLGTATTVLHGNVGGLPTWGQVMIPDIGATGTPSASTFLRGDGTWATVAGAGTVTTSGAPAAGQAAFFTAGTVIAGDAKFLWDNTTKKFVVGLANDVTSTAKVFTASGRSTGVGDPTVEIKSTFAGASPTANHPVALSLVGDFTGGGVQPVGFGVTLEFDTRDYAGAGTAVPNAFITSRTQTLTPMTAELELGTSLAGVMTSLLRLDGSRALFVRPVRTQVVGTAGGPFIAAREYPATTPAVNDTIGGLLFEGVNTAPAQDAQLASILAQVDGTGGTRIKGRLTFQTSSGTDLLERLRITSDGLVSVGLGSTAAAGAGTTLTVAGANLATAATVRLESTHPATSEARTALALVHTTPAAQMASGASAGLSFGVRQDFILRDQDGVDNVNVRFLVSRAVEGDAFGGFDLYTASTDGFQPRFSINGLGQVGVLANPLLGIGTFAMYATGTARTHLTFFSNNNANNVQLAAPTATDGGNHVWRLPPTFGTANQVLTNDGAGNLFWGTGAGGGGGGVSGSGVAGRVAYWNGAASLTSSAGFAFSGSTLTAPGDLVLGAALSTPASLVVGPGTFALKTTIGGVSSDRLTVNATGQMFYVPTPTVGTFGFTANGARTTEVQFFTPNNTNSVGFVAPPTATGNHMWRLPMTAGTANTVLTNDGAGNLSWGANGVTGTGASGRVAYWTPTGLALTSTVGFSFVGGLFSTPGDLQVGNTAGLLSAKLVSTASTVTLQTEVSGTLSDRLTVTASGQMFYVPTPSVGTFGFTANGARTTEVLFFTPNNTTSVGLVAPASSTGNHLWRLPTTFGGAGTVLTHNGAGDLSWGSPGSLTAVVDVSAAGSFQAAHDALPATGGGIYCPPGTYTTAQVVLTKPVMIFGLAGQQACVIQSSGTGNLFAVNLGTPSGNYYAGKGVAFRNVQMRPGSAGAAVVLDSTTAGAGQCANLMMNSVQIQGGFDGIRMVRGCSVHISDTSITDYGHTGITFMNTEVNDGGLYHLTNSKVCSVAAAGANAITYTSGSALYISNSYLCSHSGATSVVKANFTLTQPCCTIFHITGSTLEGQGTTAGLEIINTTSQVWHNISITGNSFAPAGPAIRITSSGTGTKFRGMTITGNVIQAPSGSHCMDIGDVHGLTITGNTCNQGGGAGQIVTTGSTSVVSTGNNLFNGAGPLSGELVVGPTPFGSQAAGPLKVTLINADNVAPYQAILGQMVNGSSAGVVQTSIANDKAAVSGWAFRGAGGSSPVYGGHFGVKVETPGVTNGVEIGVQNNTGAPLVGNGLWVNGSGANNRDNALLIDTQNGTKWNAGIRFMEGFVAGGATGSIAQFGIIFDKSHDADFLVIRPRVGAGNAAIRITDPAFSVNKFMVTNTGDITAAGNIDAVGNIGANQYFSGGGPGFGTPGTGTIKSGASCVFKIAGGLIIDVTGC